ncbi:MAG TPA: bifunctional DNA primase/polymerase [Pyrinomonadaceae bacterium]
MSVEVSTTSQSRNLVNPPLGGGLNELQTLAADYASHGLAPFPALPHSKEPITRWKAFQFQAPNQSEREALFSINASLNIGLLCGAASGNLAVIDCESPKAFETNIRRVVRAGFGETWMAESARGGHIYFRTPVPIKPIKCDGDMELRGQSQSN